MSNITNLSRIDVASMARAAGAAQGDQAAFGVDTGAGGGLSRLAAESCVSGGLHGVSWRLQAEMRAGTGSSPQPWLRTEAEAVLPMVCQRCLEPVESLLVVDRWFRFVADEATASAEDDVSEEDVLVLEPRMDVGALIEDELLMAMPLVPMHGECPVPVPMVVADPDFEDAEPSRPHPFANLTQAKVPRSLG